jgi:hypothetical protein
MRATRVLGEALCIALNHTTSLSEKCFTKLDAYWSADDSKYSIYEIGI